MIHPNIPLIICKVVILLGIEVAWRCVMAVMLLLSLYCKKSLSLFGYIKIEWKGKSSHLVLNARRSQQL